MISRIVESDRIEWDHFPREVRLMATGFFMVLAAALYPASLVFSGIVIGLAALIFHVEYRLSLNLSDRTFERRVHIRPFGHPRRGPLSAIRTIELSKESMRDGTRYSAAIVFEPGKPKFVIAHGSLA